MTKPNLTYVDLIDQALTVRQHAYAPYSNYLVGAALLSADGQIFTGVNVENASYGLTNCAERTAVFKMVTAGQRHIAAMAIAGSAGVTPCGACRQVLAEFATDDLPIYLVDTAGDIRETTLGELLPNSFRPNHLTQDEQHG